MVNTFINRSQFTYGIRSLDELLKLPGAIGNTGKSSFLLFDEQILKILIAGGIPGPEAYATVKAIKKKKIEKVLAEKEKFKQGFGEKLMCEDGATAEKAGETVEKIWTIIENAASYMFCAAHAYAMACDSLYAAWLKAYYPFEFYATILKLYTNKGNKDKVTQIINEMRKFAGISLTIGKFGQDNRDWFIDKEKKTISQSLASISFMSPKVADDLYIAGEKQYETFTDLLWYLLNNTCLNTRQIEILIGLGYFNRFGRTAKLMNVFEEFYKGKNKLTKTIKSYENRLQWNRENEASLRDEDLPIADRVRCECFNTGLCFSHDGTAAGQYIITDVDDKYRITVTAYNMARGSDSPPLRMKKNTWQAKPLKKGDCILLRSSDVKKKPRYNYKDGVSTIVPDAFDWWLESYRLLPEEKIAKSA